MIPLNRSISRRVSGYCRKIDRILNPLTSRFLTKPLDVRPSVSSDSTYYFEIKMAHFDADYIGLYNNWQDTSRPTASTQTDAIRQASRKPGKERYCWIFCRAYTPIQIEIEEEYTEAGDGGYLSKVLPPPD